MNIEELMIGDCVLDGRKQAQITAISCDGIIETTVNPLSNIELIEPIPLTPEILEKNGFIGKPYGYLKLDEQSWMEYYYHEHRLRKWWEGVDEYNNSTITKDICFECNGVCYVHLLQNALRLCGIDKTIEL